MNSDEEIQENNKIATQVQMKQKLRNDSATSEEQPKKKITFQTQKPQVQRLLQQTVSPSVIESEPKDDVKMVKASKQRFGHKINFDKCKTSNLIKVICITLAIIIIPLEIFVQHVLQDREGDMIVNLQQSWGTSSTLIFFMRLPIILVRPAVTCLFMCFFYLATDSLIAFKSAILTCFGFYFITFLKLLYKDGRPFWLNEKITSHDCVFDFAGPGYHLYIITFFWTYNIIMYCMKYSENVNQRLVGSLFGILILVTAWIVIAGLYTGSIFIYQNVIGLLYGMIYLVMCLNFDREIHKMCEKTGFIVQSSRKYKFYLFFLCIGLFIISMVYYNCELDNWTMPQTWVVNVADNPCKNELLESSNNRLGLDQTFFYTSILFFITGMGFGTSYSLVHVDCLDWVHTSLPLRILRGIIGCGLVFGAYLLFQMVPANDNPTRFFFRYALPSLTLSFFIYGVMPIISMKLGMVKQPAAPSIVTADPMQQAHPLQKKKGISMDLVEEDMDEETMTEKAPLKKKNKV